MSLDQSVIRPALLYGMETVAMNEKQVGKMEVAELIMVRWALGVTRKDKIKNEYVRGTAKIAKLGEKLRGKRLRWYGHVKRRRLRWEKNDRDGNTRSKKERKAKEKMDRFGERRHGDGWSKVAQWFGASFLRRP